MLGMLGLWQPVLAATNECAAGSAAEVARLDYVRIQVHSMLQLEGVSLELTPIGTLPAIDKPQLRLLSNGLRSRLPIEVRGRLCGREQSSTSTVWFKVRGLRKAWVYGRNSKAEVAVSAAQPRREEIDLAALQVPPEELPEDLDGLWLTQSVHAGMPILRRHLQVEPLVQRSTPVDVVVSAPGLMIRTQGKAMRSGALGETIPVLLEGGESSLQAVVSGKGEVHVEQ